MNSVKIIFCVIIYCTFFLVFQTSCSKDSELLQVNDFPTDVGRIFASKCATSGCHNSKSYLAAAGLNLTSYAKLFEGTVNGSSVIPFRSDFSSLCYFINTYDELGIKNNPTMPLNTAPLSKEEVSVIKNWIDNGAPDLDGNIMWADNLNRKKYYVLNQGCDVVTVFDADTQLPMRYITVGNNASASESPHMIKVSPDGQFWYVIFASNNILQKYKTSNDSFVGEVSLGAYQNWNTIAISDNSKLGYCVSWQSDSRLAVVDLENMKLKYNIGAGNFNDAHGIALNNTNDTIYITRQTGNYIYKIDTAFSGFTEVVLDASGIPNQTSSLDPHEITFSPDGNNYFVSCQTSNEVRVFKTQGDVFLQSVPTGQYPLEFVKSVSKNKLFVSCQNEPSSNPKVKGCITMIDLTSFQSTNYSVGYQPHGIAVDEPNSLLIVASRNIVSSGPAPHHTGNCGRNGFVNYFDLNSMQLLDKKTEVASDPYSVSIRP
jgi:DNA-binding beta-propeller fold protein YncE